MTLWQEYLQPKTITEAIDALANATAPSLPIAGGTDLILDLDQGRHPSIHTLVDITAVREMLPIEIRGNELFIGASVTHAHIIGSELVARHGQALVEACELIGGPQVRNVATLGGNVAHALPAADGTIALMALDAQVEIANQEGTHRVPIAELFLGPGKSALKQNELLVGFYIKTSGAAKSPGESSCFKRVMRPQGVALPIINLAVWLARAGNQIAEIRIAVGPAGPKPWRALGSEIHLEGKTPSDETVHHALELLLKDAQFRTSPHRSSAEYRRELAKTLFVDTLETAWERASH
jgi:xanthine dehydrogenase FAD-binding subunit